MRPVVGRSTPPSRFSSVVLPQPLGPMIATASPVFTSHELSRSACTSSAAVLYCLLTPAIATFTPLCLNMGFSTNPYSPIRNPQSAIRNPQSAIRNPQSRVSPPTVAYIAFDLLRNGEIDLRDRPFVQRRTALERLLGKVVSPELRISTITRGDGRGLYRQAIDRG